MHIYPIDLIVCKVRTMVSNCISHKSVIVISYRRPPQSIFLNKRGPQLFFVKSRIFFSLWDLKSLRICVRKTYYARYGNGPGNVNLYYIICIIFLFIRQTNIQLNQRLCISISQRRGYNLSLLQYTQHHKQLL